MLESVSECCWTSIRWTVQASLENKILSQKLWAIELCEGVKRTVDIFVHVTPSRAAAAVESRAVERAENRYNHTGQDDHIQWM